MYDHKFEMDVSYGDFGEAPEAVKEATGKNRLDIRLKTIWTEDMGEGLRELVMIYVLSLETSILQIIIVIV